MFFADRYERDALGSIEEFYEYYKKERSIEVDIVIDWISPDEKPCWRKANLSDEDVATIMTAMGRLFSLFPKKSVNANEFIEYVVQCIIEETRLTEWQVRAVLDVIVKKEKTLPSISDFFVRFDEVDKAARWHQKIGVELDRILRGSHTQIINAFSDDVLQKIRAMLPDFPDPAELFSDRGVGNPICHFPILDIYDHKLPTSPDWKHPAPIHTYVNQQTNTIIEHIRQVDPWPILPLVFNLWGDDNIIEITVGGVEYTFKAVDYFNKDAMPSPDRLPLLKDHYRNIWREIASEGIITNTQRDDAHNPEEEF